MNRHDGTVALDVAVRLRELGGIRLRGHRVVRRRLKQPIEFLGIQVYAVPVARGSESHVGWDHRNAQFQRKFGGQ